MPSFAWIKQLRTSVKYDLFKAPPFVLVKSPSIHLAVAIDPIVDKLHSSIEVALILLPASEHVGSAGADDVPSVGFAFAHQRYEFLQHASHLFP